MVRLRVVPGLDDISVEMDNNNRVEFRIRRKAVAHFLVPKPCRWQPL